jgi:hypothetical protein
MQADGNFVLYTKDGSPVWATATSIPGAYLILQDNRNLVIYAPNGTELWASNTSMPPEVHASTGKQEVGHGKFMTTDATLYRNGLLKVNTYEENTSWIAGLRGLIFVVCVDAAGRAIWVSQVFQCPTRCSVPDVSCASNGGSNFLEQFPVAVGKYTSRLDINVADDPHFSNQRDAWINAIKAAGDVAQELKDEWKHLQ